MLELCSGSRPQWSRHVQVSCDEGTTRPKQRQPHRSQLEEMHNMAQDALQMFTMHSIQGQKPFEATVKPPCPSSKRSQSVVLRELEAQVAKVQFRGRFRQLVQDNPKFTEASHMAEYRRRTSA